MELDLNVEFAMKQWIEHVANDTMRMIHALRSTSHDDLIRHVDAPAGLVGQIVMQLNWNGFVELSSDDGHTDVHITKKGDEYVRFIGCTVHFET